MNPNRRALLKSVAAAAALAAIRVGYAKETKMTSPQLILTNGRITTLDRKNPEAEAVAIANGSVLDVGRAADIMPLAGPGTKVIDLKGRRVIPGLNDSHTHLIRGGLNFNMELRWEGVPSLADALRLLRLQADRTPAPQWVRVVGGWSEFQFAERRMPTLDEINFHPLSLRPCAAQSRCAQCARDHQGHAEPARRRDREGRAR
jgi:predicted amidohydrolase YtcJ